MDQELSIVDMAEDLFYGLTFRLLKGRTSPEDYRACLIKEIIWNIEYFEDYQGYMYSFSLENYAKRKPLLDFFSNLFSSWVELESGYEYLMNKFPYSVYYDCIHGKEDLFFGN
ncbi:hypothetical protein JXC34_06610 [Candidatus Woesearchaeota archaeon]|nr:hypothetical protein [Candidatus Woesearchaeota archaeon]